MKTKYIIEKLALCPSIEEKSEIDKKIKIFSKSLSDIIKSKKIKADLFVGGSVAKNTFIKKDKYEVDLFVRFHNSSENISLELEKIIKLLSKKLKLKYEKLHGSRDYFRIEEKNMLFELIPVIKIKRPEEAGNITDLSYFHVNYVKKNINKKIIDEILIAKAFFKSQGVYGAESYIQGFSGYSIECLLIHYKTFEKMIKDFIKNDKIIIDIKKFYKNKEEIMILLNESKTKSPIVFVDPTWKERNVLAALSKETYLKIKEAGKKYLEDKNISYFEDKPLDIEEFKRKATASKSELVEIMLKTDKQAGDIAGTKMKKFYRFILSETSKYFEIIKEDFVYNQENQSKIYLVAKSKGEITRQGPPLEMKEEVKLFKNNNKNTFVKENKIYSRIKVDDSVKQFLAKWSKKYEKKIREMDITELKID